MRAAEGKLARHLRRNAQHLHRGLACLFLTVSLSLAIGLALQAHGSWLRESACGVAGFVAACLLLTLWDQERFWWAPRLLTGLMALLSVAAVYRVLLFPMAGDVPHLPALFFATVAFMVCGLPCLCFTLWGHTGGKLARDDVSHVTRMDRGTAGLLLALRWGTGIALGIYLLRLLLLWVP